MIFINHTDVSRLVQKSAHLRPDSQLAQVLVHTLRRLRLIKPSSFHAVPQPFHSLTALRSRLHSNAFPVNSGPTRIWRINLGRPKDKRKEHTASDCEICLIENKTQLNLFELAIITNRGCEVFSFCVRRFEIALPTPTVRLTRWAFGERRQYSRYRRSMDSAHPAN